MFGPEELQGGKYSFGFKFILPNNLPASLILSGSNYITYTIIAEMKQSA